MTTDANKLFYGDNLDVLRHSVADESVDLIYLDPPFNSKATYNVLFKEKSGKDSAAQIEAFEDTWHWDMAAAEALDEVLRQGGEPAQAMTAFEKLLGHNDLLAYLTMMAVRLLELHRVLKPTGSLYLHCDPTASHYLKVLMDSIFGTDSFRSEVIWKRTSAHSSAKRYGPVHDTILFYSKGKTVSWNPIYQPYEQSYLDAFYTHTDPDGRRWRRSDLTGAGTRNGETGLPWRGIDVTAKGRHWSRPPDDLDTLDSQGRIHWPAKKGGMPMLKRYADEQKGVPLQDIWTDIKPIHNLGTERLGYPTQKPEALLERIIAASSNEGDLVLDPFCGCGTAVVAAQTLGRRWIGIDVTHLAVNLMKRRLRDTFGEDLPFDVYGEPTTVEDARALALQDRFQFEWWALDLIGAQPGRGKKKGADRGIDGRKFFRDTPKGSAKQILVSVKSGKNNVQHIRDLRGVIERENAAIGVLVCLEQPTQPMRTEVASAGFYDAPWGTRHPRLQIITIEEALDGKGIDYPRASEDETFQRAARQQQKAKDQQGRLDL